LLRLSNIMLILRLLRRISITRKTSNSTSYRASDTVRNPRAEIVELALGFLGFALGVLFLACALPILLHHCQYWSISGEGRRTSEPTSPPMASLAEPMV
jgi:hypothetical protein